MSTPETPPDPLEPLASPETPEPPPEDWVLSKLAPLLGIGLGAGYVIGVFLKQADDVPAGVIGVITLLVGARLSAAFRRP